MDWIFVIVRAIPLYTTFYIVSIHLMLLFIIKMQLKKVIEYYGFNTSHVTLYQNRRNKRWKDHYCFNTSHVTLYRSIIKNIWITYCSFNTSHVTLYRENTLEAIREKLVFQYISCYSLSKMNFPKSLTVDVSIHLMLLFIGISEVL